MYEWYEYLGWTDEDEWEFQQRELQWHEAEEDAMNTNARRQAEYKQRMREAGYQQVTLWVKSDKVDVISDLARILMSADQIAVDILMSGYETIQKLRDQSVCLKDEYLPRR